MSNLLFVIIVLAVLAINCFSYFYDESFESFTISVFGMLTVISIIIISICGIVFYTSKPTAMDVYQVKTTLEITYKDGVPVDSVVVWKGGEK